MADKTAEDFRKDMALRIRWVADNAALAHITANAPIDVDLRAIYRLLHEAESSLQTAFQYAALFEDALAQEGNE